MVVSGQHEAIKSSWWPIKMTLSRIWKMLGTRKVSLPANRELGHPDPEGL